ncbi:MAG TPA: 2-amino-4-hydroxy-6-hydroxymethyldihydropteridine diphosphokinase [Chthoniobacterales bacterium]
MRVGVALGSNLGDRLENLRLARHALARISGVGEPLLASAVYATDPVDCEEGANEFHNAVIEFAYDGDPRVLHRQMKTIESALGRPADHGRNVSRAIDIDLLYAGAMEIQNEGLKVPHPRMLTRRFVLQPLAEIHPDLVLPGQQKPVSELLAGLDHSFTVVRLTNDWS